MATRLFDIVDKVAVSIARLREFEPEDGYFVAFSGGKDSIVLLDLVRRAGVRHDAHYAWTTVDPPELYRFIRQHYPDVEVRKPERTMWELIAEHKFPPTRTIRYCCRTLKEQEGQGRLVVTGIRAAESLKRSRRRMVESCSRKVSRTFLHPIIDWTTDEVWEYIRERGLPYCSLYDEGWTRLGCIMCPNGGPARMQRDAERWPAIARAYRRACHAAWRRRSESGEAMSWADGDALYEWWVSGGGDERAEETDQLDLFGDGGLEYSHA